MLVFMISGIVLYFAIVIDILQTTLSMQGGGWLTSRFAHIFWKCFLYVSGRNGRSKILSQAGYILLISIVLIWVLFLWMSFVLILYANPGAIIDSTSKMPANLWQLIYYSGFSISTLGMGDYIATGDIWKILSSVYSFTGLILLTMSVTYFVPVLSAVIDQRKLGIKLSTLGSSPEEIIISGWNGENFDHLTSKVDDLSDSIIKYSQQHRAYPVIHYFHNNKSKNAIILQLARLYETLLLISQEVKQEIQPEPESLKPLFVAFENYFEVIAEVTHIELVKEDPPGSGTEKLSEKQLLAKTEDSTYSSEIHKHRRLFRSLVWQDGWKWEQLDAKKS
ncbi:ion channel [Pontixanthobacter gangjinensis]|uniref:Two pore domain potassium channel family protein n=1 Tax=Christiangramia aestuarii TaxID=1028746 RepID=A0A7K1LQW0_9FLAO|nr:potassium channel family protein [Christiangramia aestuarii]MUP43001.1 two pore domain potassium channel family protein [Christiangramia aestuarii]